MAVPLDAEHFSLGGARFSVSRRGRGALRGTARGPSPGPRRVLLPVVEPRHGVEVCQAAAQRGRLDVVGRMGAAVAVGESVGWVVQDVHDRVGGIGAGTPEAVVVAPRPGVPATTAASPSPARRSPLWGCRRGAHRDFSRVLHILGRAARRRHVAVRWRPVNGDWLSGHVCLHFEWDCQEVVRPKAPRPRYRRYGGARLRSARGRDGFAQRTRDRPSDQSARCRRAGIHCAKVEGTQQRGQSFRQSAQVMPGSCEIGYRHNADRSR